MAARHRSARRRPTKNRPRISFRETRRTARTCRASDCRRSARSSLHPATFPCAAVAVARSALRRLSSAGNPFAIPSSIHARLRFKPSRCASFGSLRSVMRATGSHAVEPSLGTCGRNAVSHCANSRGAEHAPHEVRFREARRQEILAGRLVRERAGLVPQIELLRLLAQQRFHRRVLRRLRPVPDEAERERRLVVLADADRIARASAATS